MATLMPDSKVPASSAIKRVSATGASKYDVKLSSLKPPAAPRTMLRNLVDAASGEGGSARPVPLTKVMTRKTSTNLAHCHSLCFDMVGLPGCHQSQQHHARDGAQRAKNKILRP